MKHLCKASERERMFARVWSPALTRSLINEWKSWIFNKCWKIYSIRKWLHWAFFRKRIKNTQRQQQQPDALFSKRRKFHHVCVLCIVPFSIFGCAFKLNKNVYLMNFCVSRCFRYFVATASVFGRMLMNNQFGIQMVRNKKNYQTATNASQKCCLNTRVAFNSLEFCVNFSISALYWLPIIPGHSHKKKRFKIHAKRHRFCSFCLS